jgi:mono/diheme cytochrome c family protein/plastocyanin
MTDTPGNEPEQRLPAPIPEGSEVEPVVAPVERFSSTPATRAVELTPERAAQVVRQSSNARWVGFLAVVIVMLFVAIYWFYEVGAPLGISESRLDAEANAQSVTDVERGYNVFEANCARCHGANGEGGIGPALNRQDKLYQHLNANYLNTVLTSGGRYVCGNPNSLMPVWSNQATPPGPLNYRQIQEVISFIRSDKAVTYIKRDPEFFTPEIDPVTGEVETFNGWVDTNYQPAPGSTPYPACWTSEFTQASAAPSGSGEPSASGSPGPAASGSAAPAVLEETAQGIQFLNKELTAPANTPFQIRFQNEDAGTPHDITIKDSTGAVKFKGETFPGNATQTYDVPALPAGTYPFVCSVHSNMTGTLTVQ